MLYMHSVLQWDTQLLGEAQERFGFMSKERYEKEKKNK